jgi:hypothetical protein
LNPELIKGALLLTAVAIGAVITLWHKILDWAQSSLYPWLQHNIPTIKDAMQDAFIWVDRYVAVPTRLIVKKAWQTLRNHLLRTVAQFERRTQRQWIRRVTSFVIIRIEQAKPVVKKIETEEDVDWDELPPEIKQAWMKNEVRTGELDVTQIRDQELAALSLMN